MIEYFLCCIHPAIMQFDKHLMFLGNSESECVTVGGNRVGVPCKFPFVYDMYDDLPYVPATMIRLFSTEKKFESCTDYNKKTGRKWCATKTTSNDRYVPGHWGECPDTYVCNTDEGTQMNLF